MTDQITSSDCMLVEGGRWGGGGKGGREESRLGGRRRFERELLRARGLLKKPSLGGWKVYRGERSCREGRVPVGLVADGWRKKTVERRRG